MIGTIGADVGVAGSAVLSDAGTVLGAAVVAVAFGSGVSLPQATANNIVALKIENNTKIDFLNE